jgi:hypothetical protein
MPLPFTWRVRAVCLVFSLLSTSADALVCTIKVPQAVVVKSDRSREFYALVNKQLYEEAARCCAACLVSKDTQVVITDSGFASHTVRVLEGPSRDCRGDLPVEHLSCR